MIPKTGIVIVFDWITIQENRYTVTTTDSKTRKKQNEEFLNPSIKVTSGKKEESLENFRNHENFWKSYQGHNFKDTRFKDDEVPIIICEITLTN